MFITKGKDTSHFKETILGFNWQLGAQNWHVLGITMQAIMEITEQLMYVKYM